MHRGMWMMVALVGCGATPAGDWEGELECDDTSPIDLEMTLERAERDQWEGTFDMLISEENTDYDFRLDLTLQFDIVIETDGGGEQELDATAEYDDADCQLFISGELAEDNCEAMGIDPNELSDINDNVEGMMWDGGDVIEIDDDDCQGELTRL